MKKLFIFCLLIILIFPLTACSNTSKLKPTQISRIGVFWWDNDLDEKKYLKFAKQNNITEIYYLPKSLDESTANFINKANKKDISVYYVINKLEYLSDISSLHDEINTLINFHNQHPKQKFAGINLFIEVHKDSSFEDNKLSILTSFVSIVNIIKDTYPELSLICTIPHSYTQELTISYSNSSTKTLPTYAHIINIADSVIIQADNNTTAKIYNATNNAREYAKSISKSILVGVNTTDIKSDQTFFNQGKKTMYKTIYELEKEMEIGTGFSINNIKSWKNLQK